MTAVSPLTLEDLRVGDAAAKPEALGQFIDQGFVSMPTLFEHFLENKKAFAVKDPATMFR